MYTPCVGIEYRQQGPLIAIGARAFNCNSRYFGFNEYWESYPYKSVVSSRTRLRPFLPPIGVVFASLRDETFHIWYKYIPYSSLCVLQRSSQHVAGLFQAHCPSLIHCSQPLGYSDLWNLPHIRDVGALYVLNIYVNNTHVISEGNPNPSTTNVTSPPPSRSHLHFHHKPNGFRNRCFHLCRPRTSTHTSPAST